MDKINIQAQIASDQMNVWDAYTNPEHIVNWNFATNEWCCPSAQNDLQVGGKYLARMEAKDGSFGFDFDATYTQIDPGKSFTFVSPDERSITVEFQKTDGGTQVHIAFDPESENPIEIQRDGWQAILNNFKRYAEDL